MSVADSRGIIHVGSFRYVLSHDGVNWQRIPIAQTTFVRALTLAPDGRIYVGGTDELGYLDESQLGQKTFVSLREKLPAEHRQFGAVWTVLANRDGVYFAAGQRLFRWHEGRFEVWSDPVPTVFQRIAKVGDAIYLHTAGQPLRRIDGGVLTDISADPQLVPQHLMGLLSLANGNLLYASRNQALWEIDPQGRATPWKTDADEFLRREAVQQALRLPDDSLLLATRNAGLIQLDARGRFIRRIDIADGLPSRAARLGAFDVTGALWLGTNNGIVRMAFGSEKTVFRTGRGYEGALITQIVRHRGQIHVATVGGVMKLIPPNPVTLTNAHLESVPGLSSPAFALASTPQGLLVGADSQLSLLPDAATQASVIDTGPTVLDLAVSKAEPGVVWGARGSGGGLVRIAHADNRWQVQGLYGGVGGNLHSLGEDSVGDVWAATSLRGVWRVQFAAALPGQARAVKNVTSFGADNPFPGPLGPLWVDVRHGEPIFFIGDTRWRFDRASEVPVKMPAFEPGSLQALEAADDLHWHENEVLWTSASTQLVRTRLDRLQAFPAPRAFVSAVTPLSGQAWPEKNILAAGRHDLAFDFTAQPTRKAARIQTRLLGYDADWTEAGEQRRRVYTNLPAGNYTFAVRAADGDGPAGAAAEFSFEIKLPWWRTLAAQLIGGVLLGAAVFGFIHWRSVALRRRNAQLSAMVTERTTELSEARDAADAANRAKSAFLANMSHELRTPLNGILGYAQILRRDHELPERQRASATIIANSGEYLLGLINDVLDLAKVEAGQLTLRETDCDLRRIVTDAVNLIRPRADAKNLWFSTTIDADVPLAVKTDPQKLRQILLNLLGNAVKFTERGGVHLFVKRLSPKRVAFTVEDSGRGIAREHVPQLFQRFASSESATQGTGLGLALSQRFAELLGGKISVQSEPGNGSRFTLKLPLASLENSVAPALPGGDIAGYEGPVRRVVIIDDDATNRALLSTLLSAVGFAVAEASDGPEGLATLADSPADLVLLDLRFQSGPDGREIAREIRARYGGAAPRIIAVSASAFPSTQREALESGCDRFLSKPILEPQLWAAIGETLKLTWRRVDSAGNPVTESSSDPLPDAAVQELRRWIAQGDITGFTRALDQFRKQLPGHRVLLDQLVVLAASYDLERAEKLLAAHPRSP